MKAPAGSTIEGLEQAPRARKRRIGIVVVLIIGLLTSAFMRLWALALQDRALRTGAHASPAVREGASFGSLDSYFLILLLGGLRGPLVMFLWATSESQKNERDLEDFDTKIELIRLLQPEFDSVHVFQTWNKAYNVSAQMAGLPNKYATVLDAIEYAKRVDRARPNNLNILMTLDQLYQHKLGSSSQESSYYRKRVREDTKYRPLASVSTATARRQRLDPLLDSRGNLRPELVTPLIPRPAGSAAQIYIAVNRLEDLRKSARDVGVALPDAALTAVPEQKEIVLSLDEEAARRLETVFYPTEMRYVYADWNDGSELQYLKRYEPFPDGVSPLALGFNYAKRAQVLLNQTMERPLQLIRGVVDSKPGLELKAWADEERERAIASEALLFRRTSSDKGKLEELATAAVPINAPISDRSLLAATLHEHDMVWRLCRDAKTEYARHIHNPDPALRHFTDYSSHVDELTCLQLLAKADYQYLLGMSLSAGTQRDESFRGAAVNYRDARAHYQYVDLTYYVPGEVAERVPGYDRLHLNDLLKDPDALAALYEQVTTLVGRHPEFDQTQSSREEYSPFHQRAAERLKQIPSGSRPPASTSQP